MESQEIIFLSGQSSSNMSIQCGELVVLDDTALEANETISIRLTSESPQVIITAGRAEAEVIIQEDANDCKHLHSIYIASSPGPLSISQLLMLLFACNINSWEIERGPGDEATIYIVQTLL